MLERISQYIFHLFGHCLFERIVVLSTLLYTGLGMAFVVFVRMHLNCGVESDGGSNLYWENDPGIGMVGAVHKESRLALRDRTKQPATVFSIPKNIECVIMNIVTLCFWLIFRERSG
jgi:hypothetical protein